MIGTYFAVFVMGMIIGLVLGLASNEPDRWI